MSAVLTPDQTQALLSTLAELADKLEPLPEPKPETVSEAALKAVDETEGSVHRALVQAARQVPARNAGAWALVLGNTMRRRLKEDREVPMPPPPATTTTSAWPDNWSCWRPTAGTWRA